MKQFNTFLFQNLYSPKFFLCTFAPQNLRILLVWPFLKRVNHCPIFEKRKNKQQEKRTLLVSFGLFKEGSIQIRSPLSEGHLFYLNTFIFLIKTTLV